MKGNKLVIAVILALIVCLVLIPTCAFAEGEGEGGDSVTPVVEQEGQQPEQPTTPPVPPTEEEANPSDNDEGKNLPKSGDKEVTEQSASGENEPKDDSSESSGDVKDEAKPEGDKTPGEENVPLQPSESKYTVEFTAGEKQYVLGGDTSIGLDDILGELGISGTVTEASSSNDSLFSVVADENGKWTVSANNAFSTAHSLTVVVDGQTYEIVVTDDNVCVVKNGSSEAEYETLQEAIGKAKDGDTIVLKDNVTETVTVSGKTITIDLNGKTLTSNSGAVTINNGGQLTITDSKGGGKAILSESIVVDGANSVFTLNSGDINVPKDYGVYCKNGGTAVINGGSIKSLDAPLTGNNTTGDMNFEVNGGTLTAERGPAIYMPGQVKLTITGGVLNGGVSLRMGQVTITGGTINAITENIDNPGDYYNYSGNVWFPDAFYVIGGTYGSENSHGNSLILNITGGTFNCTNGKGSAVAIYDLGRVSQVENINISGSAILNTNATDRKAYQVISLKDIGVVNSSTDYGKYSGESETSVTGGIYSDDGIIDYVDVDAVVVSAGGKFAVNESGRELAKDGGTVTVVKAPANALIDNVPAGVKIVNNSGNTIYINGVEVKPGETVVTVAQSKSATSTPLSAKYFVLEGKAQQWTDGDLEFVLNSNAVVKVLIDGVEVEFTVAEDGTVTIASAVIEALDAGTHEIEFVFADGSCTTTFTK